MRANYLELVYYKLAFITNYCMCDPQEFYRLLFVVLRKQRRSFINLKLIASRKGGVELIIGCSASINEVVAEQFKAQFPGLELEIIDHSPELLLTQEIYYRPTKEQPAITHDPLNVLIGSLHGLKPSERVSYELQITKSKTAGIHLRRLIGWALSLLWTFFIDSWLAPNHLNQRLINRRVVKESLGPRLTLKLRIGIASSPKRINKLKQSINLATASYGLKKIRFRPRTFMLDAPSIASLYYFPDLTMPREDLEVKLTPNLSPPLIIKNRLRPEVLLGVNDSGSETVKVGLNGSERLKHLLVIGGTGMGKSTMLGYSFAQDMAAGRGATILDPHGDLANDLLNLVPSSRINDLIYLDPADLSYPIGINLLELPQGLSEEQLDIAKDFITEAIVSIFRKVFTDDEPGGHRIEYILRNTIHTAFSVEGATLFTLNKLLTNDMFRVSVVSKLTDDSLRDFWYGEFNKAGSYQRVKMIAGVTAKLGRFQRSVASRRILEQPISTINFDQILDQQKIVICNLAKCNIGEDTSSLIGMIMLAKLQLAAWRRYQVAPNKRRPYYLYVDEFQSFACSTLTQLVSESRKFGLGLVMAEQTLANQDQRQNSLLLANVGNIVTFRTAASTDNDLLSPLFVPYLSQRDIINLEPYKFYMRLATDNSLLPLSGKTIKSSQKRAPLNVSKLIAASRTNYAHKYEAPIKTSNNNSDDKIRIPNLNK